MTRFVYTICAILFGAVMTLPGAAQSGGYAANTSSGKESAGSGDTDSTFVKKAARGGLAEIELGQLAAQRASSDEVKKFGQRMVDDHSKANEELKQLAAEKHIDLPQDVNAEDKATKARLAKLSGEKFDKAYIKGMVKDHQKDVAEFEQEARVAKDPQIRSFAEQTLPTLKDHLQEAEKIAPNLKQSERTSGQ